MTQTQQTSGYNYCPRRKYRIAGVVCNKIWDQNKCNKCTHNKEGNMSKQKEVKIAKENGYHRIGKFDVSVKKVLTSDEKIELSKKHCELIFETEDLLTKKKRFDDSIKGEIAVKAQESREAARMIYDGYKFETVNLPCFLDTEQQERVYIDTDTGEEIAREPMREEDKQAELI